MSRRVDDVSDGPRYAEDFETGHVFELGAVTMTEADIVSFATAFDPQVFHVDPVRATDTVFGGLIASGWHTASAFMRLFVVAVLLYTDCRGSPGIDKLVFRRPVRPGDTLNGRATVSSVDVRRDRGGGVVSFLCEFRNEDDVIVFSMQARTIFGLGSKATEHPGTTP